MGPNHMTRRTFGAGLALGIPAALAGSSTLAQTPSASPAAGDALGIQADVSAMAPDALLAALQAEPFRFLHGGAGATFEPQPWDDLQDEDFGADAVGGVIIVRSDGGGDSREQVLGGYAVYPDAERAGNGLATLQSSLRGEDDVLPLAFAGLEGFSGISREDANADSYLRAGNVVVLATDIFLADGARTNRASVVFQSTVYAVSMVEHLARITRQEDE